MGWWPSPTICKQWEFIIWGIHPVSSPMLSPSKKNHGSGWLKENELIASQFATWYLKGNNGKWRSTFDGLIPHWFEDLSHPKQWVPYCMKQSWTRYPLIIVINQLHVHTIHAELTHIKLGFESREGFDSIFICQMAYGLGHVACKNCSDQSNYPHITFPPEEQIFI